MSKLSEETKQKFADTFDIDNLGTDLSDVYSWMTEKMEEKGKMPRKETGRGSCSFSHRYLNSCEEISSRSSAQGCEETGT